jgi:putative transposase
MSRKKKVYSTEFKTKLVLKGEKTLNEIASANRVIPKNLQNWKATFLANAELVMEPSKAVKKYKDENVELKAKIEEYAKVVGKITVKRDWLQGKLVNLGLSKKQEIAEPKLNSISLSRQCELLEISRNHFYYTSVENKKKIAIKKRIEEIFEEIPIYGKKKVDQQLLEDGFSVSLNSVSKYRRELGLRAILAVKPVSTSMTDEQHPKYSYKLKDIDINRANQVWSTDNITYIKINGGMVYMAAVIDWYSKAVLSWQISNSMDSDLVMGVLNEALFTHGKPEIFNTDQGSQYTSYIHTQTLKDNDITISMDGKGRATDDVFDYTNFYNHGRFYESLEYKKPMGVYHNNLTVYNKNHDNFMRKVG